MQAPMTQALPQSTSHKNMRVVRMEPNVKSIKTRKLSLRGVIVNSKTGKSADPTCYNAVTVELRTGLFENVERDMTQQYPVGGPRQPVYDLMAKLGFSMSNWSDKHWQSADGINIHIYGAGSMARIWTNGDERKYECGLDEVSSILVALRQRAA